MGVMSTKYSAPGFGHPPVLQLFLTDGGLIELKGASHATLVGTDGSRFDFCSACSPVLLKSLVETDDLVAAIDLFKAAAEAAPNRDECVLHPQISSRLSELNLDIES